MNQMFPPWVDSPQYGWYKPPSGPVPGAAGLGPKLPQGGREISPTRYYIFCLR